MLRNAERVSGSGGIALFDGHYRGLHKAFKQRLDVAVQAAVFVSDRGLRGQRFRQTDRARRERLHLAIQVRRGQQARRAVAFAVEQLHDANNVSAGILHGDG